MPEAKRLKLANDNNRLQCKGFVVINFAPEAGSVRESDFDKTYLVPHEGKEVNVKLIDFLRLRFNQIGSVFTIPASGLTAAEWSNEFRNKNTDVKDDTEMAIYCYQKLRD